MIQTGRRWKQSAISDLSDAQIDIRNVIEGLEDSQRLSSEARGDLLERMLTARAYIDDVITLLED